MGFKIAAVPFHMWAPDVYEGAPTPVTAFLSVGSKAASFAMVLRIFREGVPSMDADWRLLFEVLAIVTMIVGNVAALTQSNIKRLLAYSSIAHAGYLMMGIVAGTSRGVTAMLIYLLIYSFMQLGAFTVIVLLHRKDIVGEDLKDFSGLHFRSPFAAFAMLIFMLSLGGIPPTAGFMGKFWLFGAAIEVGLRVAGGDRRAEQCAVALLLRAHRGLHVSEERDHRFGAGDEPGAGLDAGRGGAGDASCSASIPASCSSSPRFRRGRWAPAASRRRSADAAAVSGGGRARRGRSVQFRSLGRDWCAGRVGELFHKVRYTPPASDSCCATVQPTVLWWVCPRAGLWYHGPLRQRRMARERWPGGADENSGPAGFAQCLRTIAASSSHVP